MVASVTAPPADDWVTSATLGDPEPKLLLKVTFLNIPFVVNLIAVF